MHAIDTEFLNLTNKIAAFPLILMSPRQHVTIIELVTEKWTARCQCCFIRLFGWFCELKTLWTQREIYQDGNVLKLTCISARWKNKQRWCIGRSSVLWPPAAILMNPWNLHDVQKTACSSHGRQKIQMLMALRQRVVMRSQRWLLTRYMTIFRGLMKTGYSEFAPHPCMCSAYLLLALMLHDNYITWFGLLKTAAAVEVGLDLGVGDKTVRLWCQYFIANGGEFSEYQRGKYERYIIIENKEYKLLSVLWRFTQESVNPHTCTHKHTWISISFTKPSN